MSQIKALFRRRPISPPSRIERGRHRVSRRYPGQVRITDWMGTTTVLPRIPRVRTIGDFAAPARTGATQ